MKSRHIQPLDAPWAHELRSAGFPAGVTPTAMSALRLPRKLAGRDSEQGSRAGSEGNSRAGLRIAPEGNGRLLASSRADSPTCRLADPPSSGALREVALPFMRSGIPGWLRGFSERGGS